MNPRHRFSGGRPLELMFPAAICRAECADASNRFGQCRLGSDFDRVAPMLEHRCQPALGLFRHRNHRQHSGSGVKHRSVARGRVDIHDGETVALARVEQPAHRVTNGSQAAQMVAGFICNGRGRPSYGWIIGDRQSRSCLGFSPSSKCLFNSEDITAKNPAQLIVPWPRADRNCAGERRRSVVQPQVSNSCVISGTFQLGDRD